MQKPIKPGHLVEYTYRIRGNSAIEKTKQGIFYGLIKHTKRHWQQLFSEQMAVVIFEGNETASRVRLSLLKAV